LSVLLKATAVEHDGTEVRRVESGGMTPRDRPMNPFEPSVASDNPYAAPGEAGSSGPAPLPKPVRPRVWTVFVAFVIVCVGVVVAQIPVTVVLVLQYLNQGGDLKRLGAELGPFLTRPWNFMALAASGQMVLAAAALIPAWLSPVPLGDRLGLVRMHPPAWWYPIIAVGAWLPGLAGLGLAIALSWVLAADESPKLLYEQMTWSVAGPFIAFLALAPGFFEEMFFRGYIQRRLLERWPAWAAIGTASLLFGVLHIMPHAVVFALPIGVWLGVVAWRTGSIWPCIVCHAFINGSWSSYQIATHLHVLPDPLPLWALIVVGMLIVVCFAASLWLMTWTSPPGPVAVESAFGSDEG
jgi:uncharacterized protein